LAHVDSCAFELTGRIRQGEIAETTVHFVLLKRSQEEPTLALLSSTTSTSETMNVRVAFAGEANLDHVSDIGEIHSSGCDVGGEEDTILCGAEVICSPRALLLAKLGVDFEVAHTAERCATLATTTELVEAATELVEYRGGECDLGGAVEIDNGLERAGFTRLGQCGLLLNEFVKGGHDVLETREADELLGNTLMCWLLVLVDALGKVKAGTHSLADKVDDIAGNGGGEHEVLALDFGWVGQEVLDLKNLLLETLIKQTIGLVHD
jgi:hypothetical protein